MFAGDTKRIDMAIEVAKMKILTACTIYWIRFLRIDRYISYKNIIVKHLHFIKAPIKLVTYFT